MVSWRMVGFSVVKSNPIAKPERMRTVPMSAVVVGFKVMKGMLRMMQHPMQ